MLIAVLACAGVFVALIASSPSDARSSSVRIVAKVGDLVITSFQVEARSKLLLQQSAEIRQEAGAKAKKFFQKRAQQRWKQIAKSDKFRSELRDYVMARRPTSREEQQKYVKQFVKQRQKRMAKRLQGEARSYGLKAVSGSLKKKALDNLIEEKLKIYDAKRLNVLVSDDEVKNVIKQIAQRNGKTVREFEAGMRKSGIQPGTLRDKIKADRSWQNVIKKRFGFQLAMMQSALDRYMSQSGGNAGGGDVRLDVKRIRIASAALNAGLVEALQQADRLRGRISGCRSLAGAAQSVPGARYEDLGKRPAEEINNPVVRELLKKAKVGEPVPPQIDGGNVDLWVLCGRDRGQAGAGPGPAKPKRGRKSDPRQAEIEMRSRNHLKDLRREVRIEYL